MTTTTRPRVDPVRTGGGRGKPPANARRGRTPLLLAALGVLALAVLIAVLSTGEADDAVTVEDLAGNPAILGDDLPPPPQPPAADPSVGSAAPVVNGTDFTGRPVTIGGSGDPQLLMFAASWCPACQQEVPEVVAWLDAGRLPDGVGFTTVVTGLDATRPNWPPTDWLASEGYDGQVLVDDADGMVAGSYGLPATPYWVALDADGKVVSRGAGLLSQDELDRLAWSIAPVS